MVYIYEIQVFPKSPVVRVYYSVHPAFLPSSRSSPPSFGKLQPHQANRVLEETAILPLAMEVSLWNWHVTQTRPIKTVHSNFFEQELRKLFLWWRGREDVRLQLWGPQVHLWRESPFERLRLTCREKLRSGECALVWTMDCQWSPCPGSLIWLTPWLCDPKKSPCRLSKSESCFCYWLPSLVSHIPSFSPIACSQPKTKTACDSEIRGVDFSWDCGIPASSEARMHPGWLWTARVCASFSGGIISGAPFQLIRARLRWCPYSHHLPGSSQPFPFFEVFSDTLPHLEPSSSCKWETETKHASPSCVARWSSVQHSAHCIGHTECLCLKATN